MANVCIAVPSASLSIGGGTALSAPTELASTIAPYYPVLYVAGVVAQAILALFTYTGRRKNIMADGIVLTFRGISAPFVWA